LRFKTLRICAQSGECGLTALKQTALDNKRLLADPTPKTPLSRFDPAILGLGLQDDGLQPRQLLPLQGTL
jgi:hypothetical protein